MKTLSRAALAALALSAAPAAAADFDGSKPLLCASVEAIECTQFEKCQQAAFEILNVPTFIRIDFKKKEVTGTLPDGAKRTVKVDTVASNETRTVLQGVDGQRPWTVVIGQELGAMTSTAVDPHTSFIVFGHCTPL
jgi:hypothetical protein